MPEWDEQGNPIPDSAGAAPSQEWDEQGNPVGAAAPAPVEPPPEPGSMALDFIGGAAKGAGRAALAAVTPADWARALKAAAVLGYKVVKPPLPGRPYEGGEALREVAQGAVDIGKHALTNPEAAGEVVGSVGVGMLPFGRMGAAFLRRGVPVLGGANEASRAYNIKRALRIPTGSSPRALKAAADIESMAPEIRLPVSVSSQSLARGVETARKRAGTAVAEAEAALPDVTIPVETVVRRLPAPEGKTVVAPPRTVSTATGVLDADGNPILRTSVVRGGEEFVPYSAEEAARYAASRAELEKLGETLTTRDLVEAKRAAQRAASQKGGYLTPEAKGAAAAAKERATAIRETMESLPGDEAAEFGRANRRYQVARTVSRHAAAEASRERGLPLATRGSEMLFGRAFTRNPSVLGAAAGLIAGNILDSRLFHTASAAIKRRVIDALDTGNPQLAADILMRSSIADFERRRLAAQALQAQGEGVVAP